MHSSNREEKHQRPAASADDSSPNLATGHRRGGIRPLQPNSPSGDRSRLWGTLTPVSAAPGELSQRSLTALNAGLVRAWERGRPIGWILARVRCEILRLPPHQYGIEHGHLTTSTLNGLERGRTTSSPRHNPEVYTRLLRGWKEFGSRSTDPTLQRKLSEATDKLLDELTASEPSAIFRVYRKWRILAGPERFEVTTKLQYANLWSRSRDMRLPEFAETLAVGRSLGFIPADATREELLQNRWFGELRDAWLADSPRRERSVEMSRLHTILAASGTPINLRALGPASPAGLHSRTVDLIAQHQPVPWAQVAPLYRHLVAEGVLSQQDADQASAAWTAEDARREPCAADDLREIARARGLTNRFLADALDIPSQSNNKPALPVFRALSYNEGSYLAPLGVLAHLIVSDDTQLERILEKRRGEIAQMKRRMGSNLTSEITAERLLWNVELDQLPFEKKEVQALEWRPSDPAREREITAAVRRVGEERAAKALHLLSKLIDESSVAALFSSLIYRSGAAPLESSLETSARLLRAIAGGEELPTLTRLRSLLDLASRPLSPQLELDWRLRAAEHQAFLTHSDLLRFLNCYVAETAESRQAAIEATGNTPVLIAQHFHALSASGHLPAEEANRVADALGMTADSPVRRSLALIIKKGTISGAIEHSLSERDGDGRIRAALAELTSPKQEQAITADSLPALRRLVGGNTAPTPSRDLALAFLRRFPGATLADISRALAGAHTPPERELFREFTQCIVALNLPIVSLPAIAAENLPLKRKVPHFLREAITAGIPSPYFPLGAAAYLSASDAADALARIDRARAAIQSELEALQVPVSEIAIQLRLWSVRHDDITFPDKSLNAAIWGPDRHQADRALPLVQSVADAKRVRTLQRALARYQAASVSSILPWAVDSLPGAEQELCSVASLSFGSPSRLADGSLLPYIGQLRSIARVAGIRVTPEIQLNWTLSLGEHLARDGNSPAARLLLAQAAIAEVAQNNSFKNRWDGPFRSLVVRSGLDSAASFRVLRRLQKHGVVDEEQLKPILSALGYDSRSHFAKLFSASLAHASMSEAIGAWGARLKDDDPMLAPLDSLLRAIANPAPSLGSDSVSIQELLAARQSLLARPPAVDKRTGALGMLLAGATVAEISAGATLLLQRRAEQSVSQSERQAELAEERARRAAERVRTEAQVIPSAAWLPTPEQRAQPFETKLDILSERLRRDIKVTNQELLLLFERERPLLRGLDTVFGHELPWFVGALAAFRHPDAALAELRKQLAARLVPKHPGKVHFQNVMTWLDQRGSLGKLNESSVRLGFTEPFVPPKPYQPRRREE